MKQTTREQGIIAEHFFGVGTVTRDMVVQRAREIALINGHPPQHYTRDDFVEARRELTGSGGSESEEEEFLSALTLWDEEPGSSGHPAEKIEAADEQTMSELLVEEGISEAEHDQMVEGAKNTE